MTGHVLVVIGAGPGVGAAVAHRFGIKGYAVGLVGRAAETMQQVAEGLHQDDIMCEWTAAEIGDAPALAAAIERFGQWTGRIDVLHYNPSVTTMRDPLTLTPEELLADVQVGVAGLLTAVQSARPYLGEGSRVIATGSRAADAPWAAAASLGVQKAGLRNLVTAFDQVLKADGIRAASVTVNGQLEEGGPFDPTHVADALHAAATQHVEDWRTEIPFNGAP